MNYSEMSDFEINKAVHKVLLDLGSVKEEFRLCPQDFTDVVKNTWDKNDGDNSVIAVMRYKDSGGYNPFGGSRDYCNSWSDAGPIIQENKIAIVPDGTEWVASTDTYFVDGAEWCIDGLWNDNPLRAAMIVFLMMKDEEDKNESH